MVVLTDGCDALRCAGSTRRPGTSVHLLAVPLLCGYAGMQGKLGEQIPPKERDSDILEGLKCDDNWKRLRRAKMCTYGVVRVSSEQSPV